MEILTLIIPVPPACGAVKRGEVVVSLPMRLGVSANRLRTMV